MARLCASRVCYLALPTALFLASSSLVEINVRAKSLRGGDSIEAVRERTLHLLADSQIDDSDAIKSIFKEGEKALPTLIVMLQKRESVERVSWALASLGGPKERRLLISAVAAQNDHHKKWLMASFLAGALVEPASDEEWRFLDTCLREYKSESFASFSAALALGVNSSPQALRLLQMAIPPDQFIDLDNDAVQEIKRASHWVEQRSPRAKGSNPANLGSDSEQIKHAVFESAFYAGRNRDSLTVEDIVFTREKNRALVSLEMHVSPKESQGFDIVLERISGRWKIIGVWATWAA